MNSSQSTPRGRPRKFDRDQALDQAMLLFWAHGYEATSVAQLAQAMDVNPPSLYAAFGDKQRLFFEAVDRYQQQRGAFITAALAEEPTARLAVRRLLLEAAQNYANADYPRGCMVITAAVNCSSASAEVMANLAGRRKSLVNAIASRLEKSIAAGELPANTEIEVLATYVVTVLYGLSIAARDGIATETLCRAVDIAMNAWPEGNALS